MAKAWVGFDLGGTKMLARVFDDEFKSLAKKRRKTNGREGLEAGMERIVQTIGDALEKAEVDPKDVAGIGVGSPGPLDLDNGVILNTPNLGWENAPLKKTLEKAFGCPALVVNDVDAGVYGEYRFGAGQGSRCALGVFPGTGIGGGCVYEGKIVRGRNRSVMEFGHMQVMPDGPLCGCGRRGCVEAVASRLAISAAAAAAAYRGEAPKLLESAGGMDLANIRSSVLVDSVNGGDRVVEEIIRDAARWLGIAIGNVVNLLGPDVVILGGGLVEAMPEIYVEEVARSANARVMPSFEGSFKVVAATLADDATVMGAAAWAQDVVEGKGA
jgi:glucokinase